MDDRMFELMTKMYSEIQEMKADLKETKSDVKKIYSKIENDIEPKLEALFDGYKQTFELGKQNSKRLDEIADKVSKQEVEIKVIQGGRK
ncbi:MAG TPA: hypothetical protein VF941_05165 [Clostridia bacterium]